MIYLFESKIPEDKSVFFALKYIYGINKSTAVFICRNLGFAKNLKIKNLSSEQINKLVQVIGSLGIQTESNLKKIKQLNNKKLTNMKSYRGLRKSQGLPVRGQRTHTNAKTAKKRNS